MRVEIGSRLLVTWRDRVGERLAVSGTVSDWYSHDFSWGKLSGAMLRLDKPLQARGTRLGTDATFEQPGVTPQSQDLLLVGRDLGPTRSDFGSVQVELRPADPALDDQPGWWLSG